MPRPEKPIKPTRLNISIPIDIATRLHLHLFSELEQKVPYGAYSAFMENILRDYFRRIDGQSAADFVSRYQDALDEGDLVNEVEDEEEVDEAAIAEMWEERE